MKLEDQILAAFGEERHTIGRSHCVLALATTSALRHIAADHADQIDEIDLNPVISTPKLKA